MTAQVTREGSTDRRNGGALLVVLADQKDEGKPYRPPEVSGTPSRSRPSGWLRPPMASDGQDRDPLLAQAPGPGRKGNGVRHSALLTKVAMINLHGGGHANVHGLDGRTIEAGPRPEKALCHHHPVSGPAPLWAGRGHPDPLTGHPAPKLSTFSADRVPAISHGPHGSRCVADGNPRQTRSLAKISDCVPRIGP